MNLGSREVESKCVNQLKKSTNGLPFKRIEPWGLVRPSHPGIESPRYHAGLVTLIRAVVPAKACSV